MKAEFVTIKTWESYAKRLVRAQLKAHGTSLSFTSTTLRASKHIIEVQQDLGGLLVSPGWRDTMQQAVKQFTPLKEDHPQ